MSCCPNPKNVPITQQRQNRRSWMNPFWTPRRNILQDHHTFIDASSRFPQENGQPAPSSKPHVQNWLNKKVGIEPHIQIAARCVGNSRWWKFASDSDTYMNIDSYMFLMIVRMYSHTISPTHTHLHIYIYTVCTYKEVIYLYIALRSEWFTDLLYYSRCSDAFTNSARALSSLHCTRLTLCGGAYKA